MENNEEINLLSNCTSGGCGAKIGPGELSKLLDNIQILNSDKSLIGFESSDDAAVYLANKDTAIISTVDFFSPMINDPYIFGQIAATNALSDVYAMGGKPVTALNLVCFPQSLDLEILGQILKGGAEKVMEAEAVLSGGHSIYDKEPKYGLSVTGIAIPDKILRNNTTKIGDKLILTKPLGVGIVMAAHRGEMASEEAVNKALKSMTRLNKYSAEKMENYNVSACTDITGFGLLGHLLEMVSDGTSINVFTKDLPYITEAYDYANQYLMTAAGQRNRNHLEGKCDVSNVLFPIQELLFDPQTSGGLLISINEKDSHNLLNDIQKDDPEARIIGEVIKEDTSKIIFS